MVEDGITGEQLDNGLVTNNYYHQYVVRQMLRLRPLFMVQYVSATVVGVICRAL